MPVRDYKMPAIDLGPCVWRLSPHDGEWVPALVTAVGDETLNLTVFAPDNRGGMPRDGVRHVSDPTFHEHPQATDNGCWDHSPLEKRLKAAERAVGELLEAR